MQHAVITAPLGDLAPDDRIGMFRLRYEVFHDRLGWDVKTTADGQEIDEFDAVERAHYILARSPSCGVDACWRLLPTLGPNMLRDVFPELLHGQPAPAGSDCAWCGASRGRLTVCSPASLGPRSASPAPWP